MASKVYTAEEMRHRANQEQHLWNDRTTAAMLRQAADAMEREKKYEYTHKYGDDVIAVNHTDDIRKCFVPMGAVMVRREVGEWEEVKDA